MLSPLSEPTGALWRLRSRLALERGAARGLPMQDVSSNLFGRFREPKQRAIFRIDDAFGAISIKG
jgi:hypothetical protein